MITNTHYFVDSSPSNVNFIPELIDYNVSQITPYVFVTAENTARQFTNISSHGITCVINLAKELPQITFPSRSGIESLKYPIIDNPTFPALRYFDIVADRIAANVTSNRRTLLYCHHGRSRSITFILAYLIKHHHLPLYIAYSLVKSKRYLASPNVGFWSQLKKYELYQRNQKQIIPQILTYFQDSLAYSGQILNKMSNGFERVLTQLPIVNVFANTIYPRNRNFHVRRYYHTMQRRPSTYSYPYYIRLPRRVYRHRL
ncbi:unnamed protein product [Rotaria sordida]|uniref:Uncharacterized protein n=1 Tax=Rotaria sordida TaxID=392033 RepID=A0A813V7Y2_9BILA|nr:unnamed protein product [Rotaria sordida]CAF0833907.1 unnamed protein product [Rotaria sordida]CAF3652680.1 unnamed protein product [Rotaria sordida]CAF3744351.1 unnamed protein product [Rotaria sordida]